MAERQVVDAAEEVLTRAWIAELDEMRREGLRLAIAVRIADRMAREKLQRAQTGGRPDELTRAHARLVETSAETSECLGHVNALLASVDAELEAVCRAGLERTRRSQEDLRRLRVAWTAAYGQG
ncbi:hypothetical protein [Actinospica sp.]|uniref:hypothetical protein n=1 Tax=Actinospica sp. TaxID=1872142 RepID=UPI002BA0B395|nr:hypothetical protein [Actinospica sp.]HWG26170.1 hypothetical protein [Actinospica sp.]